MLHPSGGCAASNPAQAGTVAVRTPCTHQRLGCRRSRCRCNDSNVRRMHKASPCCFTPWLAWATPCRHNRRSPGGAEPDHLLATSDAPPGPPLPLPPPPLQGPRLPFRRLPPQLSTKTIRRSTRVSAARHDRAHPLSSSPVPHFPCKRKTNPRFLPHVRNLNSSPPTLSWDRTRYPKVKGSHGVPSLLRHLHPATFMKLLFAAFSNGLGWALWFGPARLV